MSRLLATMIMLGALSLPGPQRPHMKRHARTTRVWFASLAKEHARAYVKLLPEPPTIEDVKLAVSQSIVSTIHGQERRNDFMIALSVDSLGEVAGRVTHQRPPAEFNVLKKLVK